MNNELFNWPEAHSRASPAGRGGGGECGMDTIHHRTNPNPPPCPLYSCKAGQDAVSDQFSTAFRLCAVFFTLTFLQILELKLKMGEAACGRGDAEEQSVVGEVGTEEGARPRGGGRGEGGTEGVSGGRGEVGMEGARLRGGGRGDPPALRLGLAFFFSLPNLLRSKEWEAEVGKMTTFDLWPMPWGGRGGMGCQASYESLPAPSGHTDSHTLETYIWKRVLWY